MRKITILVLHLGFGGVEQAVINQANILSKKYEVTIASIYKLDNSPAFTVDPKVQVEYLTNKKPNRDEFLFAIRKHNLIKVLKEGLNSVKILYLKKHAIKKYIMSCDSDILISSRIYITKLLSKYGKQCIKIAEEHRHHNNDQRYIKSLAKACKGIDYLVCVSKELTNDYAKVLKNTKCVYIPNGLDYYPDKLSNLDGKRLISVGRISPEKGQLDLIDVFKIIHDIDKDVTLDIIGDGVDRGKLEEKIDALKLKKYVKLHGFQSRKYINSLLVKSSIFLMCSFEESFGTVLIEAASFGVPQIAFSSAQGAKEIILDGVSGIIIENRNKNEMAQKTIELLNNPKRLKKMGIESRRNVEQFKTEIIQEKWLNFLKDVIK